MSITIDIEKMPYSAPQIECVRFGGRVGGIGVGCCAFDIFSGFNNDPDEVAHVALTNGDSLASVNTRNDAGKYEPAYLHGTNEEIFLQYLRIGTFDTGDLPNHGFLAVMSESQVVRSRGERWMEILKREGFEFIRAVDNSVYSGSNPDTSSGPSPVYLFGLFRNIGKAAIDDPLAPPAYWNTLKEPQEDQRTRWDNGVTVIVPKSKVFPNDPEAPVEAKPAPWAAPIPTTV